MKLLLTNVGSSFFKYYLPTSTEHKIQRAGKKLSLRLHQLPVPLQLAERSCLGAGIDPILLTTISFFKGRIYYSFGIEMGGWDMTVSKPTSTYLYNGKEQDSDFGLDWGHYGFRIYDSSIARFTGIDPIADQFTNLSVHNYADNSPISNIDLHGLQSLPIIRGLMLLSEEVSENPDGAAAVTGGVGIGESVENAVGGVIDMASDPIGTITSLLKADTLEG